MNKTLLNLLYLFIVSPCFSREIVVGVINDGPHANYPAWNSTIKRQKSDVITLVKKELKRNFKNDTVTFKYIDYDESNLFKASKDIEEQIKTLKPHIIFGPYSYKLLYYLKDTIQKSNIPFISHNRYSGLRYLGNYYTPFEWNDVSIKLTLEKAKKMVKKVKPKIGAFVIVTDDYSKDTYESVRKYVKDEIYTIKITHSKSEKYWTYKHKLDEDIKKMLEYSPDIILNPNSQDLDKISFEIILKMINKAYKGIFIDSSSWGCSVITLDNYRNFFKHSKGQSTGLFAQQLKCFPDYEQDEKNFRNSVLHNDDKYYSSTGIFYKTLKHILTSILKSKLQVNSNNIQKIIQNNSYFKGFSNAEFNLYKKKDSPEFLTIYKYYFEKNFLLENLSKTNLFLKKKNISSKNMIN